MKKTRLLALLLAFVMIFGIVAACGEDPVVPDVDPPPDTSPSPTSDATTPTSSPAPSPVDPPASFNTKTARDTLVVGVPPMNGEYLPGWGNSSYDVWIRTLLHSFATTIYSTDGGELKVNPSAIKDMTSALDADGNKTYTFTLNEDLKWNNGETITAKDYVASVLYYAGPAFAAVGGSASIDGLLGLAEYQTGDAEYFAAVRLIGQFQFSLTIAADSLPYFWELAFLAFDPVYSAGWFPGIDIVTDENGSRFSADISSNAERLSETERFAPTVTCGPYTFVSFDGSICNLQRNPHFKGDYYGDLPSFEYIIQMEVPSETDVDMVISGDIDLNIGNIEGSKIEAAMASEFTGYNYTLRNGYGFIAFPLDWGPTKDINVRWGLAHILDRNAIIDHVLEGYGSLVDSAYGLAQWTYQARRRQLTERLIPIVFNLERANDFFDLTEWIYEADGTTRFNRANVNAAGTYLRHNADGEVLSIRHLSAASSVGGAIEAEMLRNAPMAGVLYEVIHGEFDTLLDHYYYGFDLPDEEREFSAFNLASNFGNPDDKYWSSYHSDFAGTWMNSHPVVDPQIDALIIAMRSLEHTEVDRHADYWLEFQVRLQQILPIIPLYSNEYYDIFNNVVIDVPSTSFWTWADAICRIHKYQ